MSKEIMSKEIMSKEDMPKYWVVGASWGGKEPQDENFLSKGIWMLGWEKEEKESQFKKAEKIELGDRIAIKKMKGRGNPEIKICHLGIVKGVIKNNKVIRSVDWVVKNIQDRNVESKGCFASVHGPIKDEKWIKEVFCL